MLGPRRFALRAVGDLRSSRPRWNRPTRHGFRNVNESRPASSREKPKAIRRAANLLSGLRDRLQAAGGPQRPRSGRQSAGALLFAASLAILAAAVLYRQAIVAAVPDLAALYALGGVPVNLRGLEFHGVNASRDIENGRPVMIIQGQIANVSGRELNLPTVRLALRNAGQEVFAWTVDPGRPRLQAGETLPFKARLASPPAGADDIVLRFADRAGGTAKSR